VAAVLVLASLSQAAELAVLRNGNSIRHEKHQVIGAITRLYLSSSSSGYIEIPSDQILRFEKDAAPPPVRAASTAPARTQLLPRKQVLLTQDSLNQMVNDAGSRNQLDPDFISSVIRAESGFHQNAVSRKGAQGLMQLMPDTASQLGVKNPFDPAANVDGGARYLRDLLQKYNFDVNKALAAYNAGPARVDQYHGIPPYLETQAYVTRIIRDFNRKKLAKNPELAAKVKPRSSRTTRNSRKPRPAVAAQTRMVDAEYARQQTGSN
jgi:soluble lytic murein transglycosylase-like protein